MEGKDWIKETVKETLRWAKEREWPSLQGGIAVAFCGEAMGSAHLYYWGLRLASWRDDVVLGDCATIASEVLPYSDNYRSLIIFSLDPGDPAILYAYDPANLSGLEVFIVSPRLAPVLEDRVEPAWILQLPGKAPLFESSIASLFWAFRHSPEGVRVSRLKDEVENLSSSVEGLIEAYSEIAGKLGETVGEGLPVAASPMMMPALASHSMLDSSIRPIPYWALPSLARRGKREKLIFYYTSVEESFYRRLLFNLRTKYNILEVRLNTDPLTAPLYAMMIQALVFGRFV